MCDPVTLAALGMAGAGAGATAAGATAAASILPMLQGVGAAVSVIGSVVQGVSGYNASQAQAAAYATQAANEAQLTTTQDQRERQIFHAQIAQQRAELAARGVQLDSVTASLLGRKAASEMSFQSQSTRAVGAAKQTELSNAEALAHADAVNSLLSGVTSAAASFITSAPDIWPGLLSGGAS